MLKPERQEIDHRTIKLIVGIVALSLASLTSLFAQEPIKSISESYYVGGWSQSIFIGFLFAISALLLAYNGQTRTEMVLSKLASLAGLGIALFPCVCEVHKPPMPVVHAASANLMFGILAYFCYLFHQRAKVKGYPQAKFRSRVYVTCGGAIALAMLAVAADMVSKGAIRNVVPRLTFFAEATGLVAFGVSWLTASRVLPFLTAKEERFSPLRRTNPA